MNLFPVFHKANIVWFISVGVSNITYLWQICDFNLIHITASHLAILTFRTYPFHISFWAYSFVTFKSPKSRNGFEVETNQRWQHTLIHILNHQLYTILLFEKPWKGCDLDFWENQLSKIKNWEYVPFYLPLSIDVSR
jgi:hypothetical protein